LFDDNTARNFDFATTLEDKPVTDNPAQEPEHPQPVEVARTETETETDKPATSAPAATEDFASALETFTTEAEEAASGDDHVIHGTVLKLTPTHVVVDIGAKSEGMLPIAEVLDHEGKPRFQPGDPIDVMREKGETEEGYINLSHQKAQRLHAWDEI